MTLEQQKQYITEQRKKGVSDSQIVAALNGQNQPGPQRSVAGELLPTAFSIGGGILGGIGGSLGGPAGTVAGGVAGAAAGGALGEAVQEGIERRYGQRSELNPGQIAAQGAISGGLQLAGAGIGKLAGFGLKVARPTLVSWTSKLSGYADDVVERALQRTPGAVTATKEGEPALRDIVVSTAKGVSDLAKKTVAETKETVANLNKVSVQQGLPGTKSSLLGESKNFVRQTVDALRSRYNIGVNREGELIFDRPNVPSNIVSASDKGAIQSAYDSIRSVTNNVSIRHVDAVLERLMVLRAKTPAGTPTGAETKAIISEMMDDVVDFLGSVPKGYGRGYPEYVQFLKDNLPKRVLINDAKELFGSSANLSPKEVSQIEKRLLQLYNTGNLAMREAAEEVGGEIGQDIVGTAAGTLIKTGDQMSVRAPNLTTRGLFEKAASALPRSIVRSYITTGKMTSEITGNPIVGFLVSATGLTAKAIMQEIANLAADKTVR